MLDKLQSIFFFASVYIAQILWDWCVEDKTANCCFNNSITTKKVIKIIRDGVLDDFVAYNDDYKEKVDLVLEAGRVLAATMEEVWTCYKDSAMFPTIKREFFEMVRNSRYCDFYCKRYDNKFTITAEEWLHRQPIDTITEWIEEEIVNLLSQEAKQ